MNLLTLLLGSLLSNASMNTLSSNTGVQKPQLSKLLILALPLIIKYMTSNTQSQSGLSSLFGALAGHQNRGTVEDQIANADVEDGQKILGHIFGNDKPQVVNNLAQQSGVDANDVSNVLGAIAPYVLSGLSAATQSAHTQQQAGVNLNDGLDLGDLMSLFGGAVSQQQAPQANAQSNGSQLINALLSMM